MRIYKRKLELWEEKEKEWRIKEREEDKEKERISCNVLQ